VNLVEQLRDLLDLVQDHRQAQLRRRRGQETLPEERGTPDELQQQVRLEEVEGEALGKGRAEVGALARLPGTPEEGRLAGREGDL